MNERKEVQGVKLGFATVDQVAEVLHFKRDTIVKMLRSGELQGTKLGHQWRIPIGPLAERLGCDPSEFKATITSRYTSPTEAAELVA